MLQCILCMKQIWSLKMRKNTDTLYFLLLEGMTPLFLALFFILSFFTRLDAKSTYENENNLSTEKKCEKVVTDRNRGLMWQDDEETKSVKTNFKQALGYCKHLKLGGYVDWKLPRIGELTSIVDKSRNPRVKKEFKNAASNVYWSSSKSGFNSTYSWIVNFNSGRTNYSDMSDEGYVRCVRNLK